MQVLVLLLAQIFFIGPTPVPVNEPGFSLEEVGDTFSSPLFLTAPEDDQRLFVVERGGAVKVVNATGLILSTPYLNISGLLPASPGPEQGLLGLAFHPDFAANGKLYVSYTDTGGALVVGELVASPTANTVSTSAIKTVIRVPQPAANHNGGMVLFGPDNYLYIGVGDGGGGGDPFGNGQNKNTLLGAILRINVDSDSFPTDPVKNYSVPGDNPFVGVDGSDEIWVYGLRNPWRFWIDPPTGRLYIGDVGQSAREEVTVLEPGSGGANLGWNLLEGSICYPPGASCSSAGTVLPQIDYVRSVGTSVTGGVVYRGPSIPSKYGTHFYADFSAGWVRSFAYTGSVTNHLDWSGELDTSLVSSFGVDGKGEMYIVSLSGTVWKLVGPPLDDEVLFYKENGTFKYYDIGPNAALGSPINAGTGYSSGWGAITAVDLEGDGQDEVFFYKDPGVFAYYDILPNATLGAPILSGTGYSHKWDSISAVDLDGDGQDEMFFYDTGLGLFSYYDINPDASLGAPLASGNYSLGWDSIASVDLNGDGRDEMFFYRSADGTFKYYKTNSDGSLGQLLTSGVYSLGWDSITSVDLDGDGVDEMMFYRSTDGVFKYYSMKDTGALKALIASGVYTSGWSSITALNLD